MVRAAALLLALAIAGCAGNRPVPDLAVAPSQPQAPGAVERVQMAPYYFDYGPEGLDIYTDTDLFRRAAAAYDVREWKKAFNLYRRIIDKFPDSPYRVLAFYNGGLCLEQLREDERALEYYRATRELIGADAALNQDVLLHMGILHERGGRWGEAAGVFDELALRPELEADQVLAWRARAGIAALNAHGADETPAADSAIESLETVIGDFRRYLKGQPYADNEWLARAEFALGEAHHRRFAAVTLALPQDRMETDLNRKAEALLRAQRHYMRTLQIHNEVWATAAVYRIGHNYEEFYRALHAAPLPPDLTEEERVVYREELREMTEPVRKKAIIAYDRIIRFANRLALQTEWVDRARERLVELRSLGEFKAAGTEEARPATSLSPPASPAAPPAEQLPPVP